MAVVRFPGSNCDLDAVQAIRSLRKGKVDLVWHEDKSISGYDAVVLPGGFSFGDYLRGGAIASRSPVIERVRKMADSGAPVLGICNGFQVLIEAGLLPGALLRNSTLRFVCKWVNVRVERTSTSFTRGLKLGQTLRLPIAHNEGRFYSSSAELKKLESDSRITFRYCEENGAITSGSNPTGTSNNIAGLTNKEGNVLGLMPHPERATDAILSPFGTTDGASIFNSMLEGN